MNLLALQQAPPPGADPATFTFALDQPDVIGGWLVCFFTLAVFSFLYRDNAFYKLAEHVFVGVGTAWFTMEYYQEGVIETLLEYSRARWESIAQSPDALYALGGYELPAQVALGLRATAAVLALMLLSRMFFPNSWMPRWPLAIMVGVYAALKMTGETQSKLVIFVAEAMPAVRNPALQGGGALVWTVGKTVFVVGMICALAHFLFTFRRTRTLAAVSRVGVVVLMITFGSMFGFTVLGRIALLIERISSLETYSHGDFSLLQRTGLTLREADVAAGEEAIVLQPFSPPLLLGALMVLLLVLGAMLRRRRQLRVI